eukprot:scaffold1419_cov410-Prasinococcus_capsulatus_cf.AAC.10
MELMSRLVGPGQCSWARVPVRDEASGRPGRIARRKRGSECGMTRAKGDNRREWSHRLWDRMRTPRTRAPAQEPEGPFNRRIRDQIFA